MKNVVKKGYVGAALCSIIGIACFMLVFFNGNNMDEHLNSYLTGFGVGILTVGIVVLIKSVIGTINPKKAQEMENNMKDERLKEISFKTLAITFMISTVAEAVGSLIFALVGKMEYAMNLGIIIWIQIIVYLITYFIVSRNS